MKKLLRKVAILMAVFTMLFSSLTAYAASPTELFDAEYYAKENPDVVAVYGNNPEKLYQHYMNYGIKEGRSLNSLFDVKSYRDRYSDLKDAFGDNWSLVLNHMLTYGLYEGRNTVDKDLTSLTTEQALTIYAEQVKARYEKDGLDENFAYFNVEEYKAAYPDLQEAFGDNVDAYLIAYEDDITVDLWKRRLDSKRCVQTKVIAFEKGLYFHINAGGNYPFETRQIQI